MEDPLFDPWTSEHEVEEAASTSGGEPEPTAEDSAASGEERPAPNGHRWTSPTGSRGVPAQRPVPTRRSAAERFDVPDAAKPSESIGGEILEPDTPAATPEATRRTGTPAKKPPAPELFEVWAPGERGEVAEAPRQDARPAPPGRRPVPADRSQRLREVVLPRLEWIAREVEAAGHRTVLDDRLEGAVPSVRFRLTPRPGPFDDSPAAQGAVIEIASGSGSPPEIVGRLWLDPLSSSPTQQVRVPGEKLTGGWIDRLLLDFVEKALADR